MKNIEFIIICIYLITISFNGICTNRTLKTIKKQQVQIHQNDSIKYIELANRFKLNTNEK